MTHIVIIDAGSGNIRSLERAFLKVGCSVTVSANPDDLSRADRIVLPGQGAYDDCMRGLAPVRDALNHQVIDKGKPYLGICVGMHIMSSTGLENGTTTGLNWIGGRTVPLSPPPCKPGQRKLTIPHIGWNRLTWTNQHPISSLCPNISHVYFAHSFVIEGTKAMEIASCNYGITFPALIAWRNCLATQFHPEKSQSVGLQLLHAFANWQP